MFFPSTTLLWKNLKSFKSIKNPTTWPSLTSATSTSLNNLSYHSTKPPHQHHTNTPIPHSPPPSSCWCMLCSRNSPQFRPGFQGCSPPLQLLSNCSNHSPLSLMSPRPFLTIFVYSQPIGGLPWVWPRRWSLRCLYKTLRWWVEVCTFCQPCAPEWGEREAARGER